MAWKTARCSYFHHLKGLSSRDPAGRILSSLKGQKVEREDSGRTGKSRSRLEKQANRGTHCVSEFIGATHEKSTFGLPLLRRPQGPGRTSQRVRKSHQSQLRNMRYFTLSPSLFIYLSIPDRNIKKREGEKWFQRSLLVSKKDQKREENLV